MRILGVKFSLSVQGGHSDRDSEGKACPAQCGTGQRYEGWLSLGSNCPCYHTDFMIQHLCKVNSAKKALC